MIRLLREEVWVEAYAGIGPVLTNPRHRIVGDKVYIPQVRERLQYARQSEFGAYTPYIWDDVPTVDVPLSENPPGA